MTTPATPAALPAEDKVEHLLRTLRSILRLTKKQGNWIRVDTDDPVGDDPDNVPAGYDGTGRPTEPGAGEALIPVTWDEDRAEGPENRLIQIRDEAETMLKLLADPTADTAA